MCRLMLACGLRAPWGNQMAGQSKGDDYRRRAEAADRQAKECQEPETRRAYKEIAQQWRDMARHADLRKW